jgi:outer membrane protein OmpA-like peptidoglycan-associated protein
MSRSLGFALAATLVAAPLTAAHGQSMWERAKKKAKERIEQQVDKQTTSKPEQEKAAAPTPPAEAAEPAPAAAPSDEAAAPSVNVGSDFTPGTRVLYATDFKRDELGDFPRAFELKSGNFEVADVGGTRYLRATSFGTFEIPLPEVLTEQFTIEFDFRGPSGWGQELYFTDKTDGKYITWGRESGGIEGPAGYRVMAQIADPGKAIVPVKVMGDGRYVKVYMNGVRVANAPNADLGRSNKLTFHVKADAQNITLIGNVRIAAGGKDLYKALAETGRVTADGIFFDTNADKLRPESAPVLKQIGEMLATHAEMKLAIEGHTDNVGAAAANQTLSDKRAAAVKAYLVQNFQIDAARLTAKGFGATKPVAPNADEAGRQKNRRVELVKI